MNRRCSSSDKKNRQWYFDKGISVCNRWRSFSNFLADMGPKPKGAQIERKNNRKGYTPSNCVWASGKQNCRNKSNNRRLSLNGLSMTVTEWSERLSIPAPTLFSRVYAGKTTREILAQ